MFESGITAKDLIEELKDEIDVALPIPDSYYVSWLNSVEQLLYSEIIKEQKRAYATLGHDGLKFDDIDWREKTEEDDDVKFFDIYTVYAGNNQNRQLSKVNPASLHIFDNVFFDAGEYLGIKTEELSDEDVGIGVKIIYFVRPIPKEIDSDKTIKIPIEFVDMIRAKIRGEAYKFANEDAIAAKWLNDYNIVLETFKIWISNREPRFGM